MLWYNQPARAWTDALPIGNGKLGAMIFGGTATEHIQFNEGTLWTGGPRPYQRDGAVQYLQPIRQLLFEGKQQEAENLAEAHFMGKKSNEEGYDASKQQWLQQVRADTAAAAPSFNDSQWPTMQLPTPNGWEDAGLAGEDGAVWFRNSFELPQQWAGKDLVIELGRIRDIDFTYINGRHIGSSEGISNKRVYIIPASVLKAGKNEIAIQVINWYDKGGLIGVKGTGQTFLLYPQGDNAANAISLSSNWKYRVQNNTLPPVPQYEASYQPFGDLWLQFSNQPEPVTGYRRELDIAQAVSRVRYTSNGITYTREFLASAPDNVIAIHLAASQPGSISLKALLNTPHKLFSTRKISDRTLALSLKVKDGVLKATAYLRVAATHGHVQVSDDGISVEKADEVTFYLTAATSFINYKDVSGNPDALCAQALQKLDQKNFDAIRAAHVKDYRQYFNTFSINLGSGANAALPTDERIRQFSDASDPSLISLYLQYARYLLISASRPGGQAANLQGLWNNLITPPWGSKYTTNINLEMNYWPAEILNLSACTDPLFRLIDEASQSGRLTAQAHYGAPGWVLHHNTDLWRGTAPINAANHGIWVTGAAWLCHHLWEHYLFTQDKHFLQTRAYPVMKAAADFFVHFLVKDPATGWLISTPSNSPEHGGLVAGPTMDHQIIRDLFKNCMAAAAILQTDKAFAQTLQEKYRQIAPDQVGRFGQLQEWLQDKDDTTDTHRHVSHLWGVYPGTDITWDTAKLMQAAKQSLLYRGDEGTGWSIAWKVNLWARFRDGDHAMRMFNKLLSPAEGSSGEKGGVYRNLFDAHPPFQIDGNFGGAAGIAEMLLQSQQGYIDLLPALPQALPNGAVKGICARGGFVLNISWQQGKLQQVEVKAVTGNECRLQYGSKSVRFQAQKGKTYVFNNELKQL